MNIPFIKCHGSSNDFLIIDEWSNALELTEELRISLAATLCDRKVLGADGILYISKSNRADAKMRVINADGSEASMCGNGLRCVARYVCEKLSVENAIIETMKAVLSVQKETDIFPDVLTYGVEIAPVSFDVQSLPMNVNGPTFHNEALSGFPPERLFTAVSVPNPHLITIVDKEVFLTNEQFEISTYLNSPNPICPDGVNVSYVHSIEKGKIFVRTYERGVGFTNACGTAMSASTLVSAIQGLQQMEQVVDVYNPGGRVQCVVHQNDEGYSMDLIGNATFSYYGEVYLEDNTITWAKKEETDEELKYEKLKENVNQFLSV
ncbi:diaminopimelate epimerase [Bacillus coahuilensis p1.1.43]|uniref:Diaminopimelate epimerase n=1 Tax=Bacillus coahuilensis p1.1.43 TaxID=1150625 RepID=A0A147K8B7_9BACI|nr:diaminopimelate epimerase [Bacillus coahuilensis]KUP06451.1 diaminopimelate epimerase [Bacillus coahuilensis p1.1.43]